MINRFCFSEQYEEEEKKNYVDCLYFSNKYW